MEEADTYRKLLRANQCGDSALENNVINPTSCRYLAFGPEGNQETYLIQAGTPAVKAGTDRLTEPSFVTARIGYTFGDTTVAASWYSSQDFIWEGSEGTAIGFGASHALPKVGATVHASVQNYELDLPDGRSQKETVFQLGTLVTF